MTTTQFSFKTAEAEPTAHTREAVVPYDKSLRYSESILRTHGARTKKHFRIKVGSLYERLRRDEINSLLKISLALEEDHKFTEQREMTNHKGCVGSMMCGYSSFAPLSDTQTEATVMLRKDFFRNTARRIQRVNVDDCITLFVYNQCSKVWYMLTYQIVEFGVTNNQALGYVEFANCELRFCSRDDGQTATVLAIRPEDQDRRTTYRQFMDYVALQVLDEHRNAQYFAHIAQMPDAMLVDLNADVTLDVAPQDFLQAIYLAAMERITAFNEKHPEKVVDKPLRMLGEISSSSEDGNVIKYRATMYPTDDRSVRTDILTSVELGTYPLIGILEPAFGAITDGHPAPFAWRSAVQYTY